MHGLTLRTSTPAHLARAAVEGMLCALADGLDALTAQGATVRRVILVGGGARSAAVRRIAPQVFGCPVVVPPAGEYVADGAARQAAWVALGGPTPPTWAVEGTEEYAAEPVPAVRDQYAAARGWFWTASDGRRGYRSSSVGAPAFCCGNRHARDYLHR
ncbi:hypothetical protein GCM10027614_34210 [Micromonospora vulcania]